MESGLKGLSKHHVCLFFSLLACSCRPDPSRSSTMIHDHACSPPTSDLIHMYLVPPSEPLCPDLPTSHRRVLKNAVMGALFISYGFLLETKERRKSPNLSTSSQKHGKTRTNIFDFSRRKKSRKPRAGNMAGYCKPRRIYPLHLSKRHRGIRKAKRNFRIYS